MSEVKKTITRTTKKEGSKRSSNSCKVRVKGAAKSGTGPGKKNSDHKK